ncbi:hypothetical protein EVG20_g9646 [Dentipellis fragilis]|uniref:Uncharacterized protein n=1 Tax=Dentipellis fragilis TaxID=205917 RepID=A0A4Y9XWH0_9AGAM|nr:hypothetical protein EVG20_g9646 [Dentipellis fragilis]
MGIYFVLRGRVTHLTSSVRELPKTPDTGDARLVVSVHNVYHSLPPPSSLSPTHLHGHANQHAEQTAVLMDARGGTAAGPAQGGQD